MRFVASPTVAHSGFRPRWNLALPNFGSWSIIGTNAGPITKTAS